MWQCSKLLTNQKMLRKFAQNIRPLQMSSIARYSKDSDFTERGRTEEERWVAKHDHELMLKKIAEQSKNHVEHHTKEASHEIKKEFKEMNKSTNDKLETLLKQVKDLTSEIEKLKNKK